MSEPGEGPEREPVKVRPDKLKGSRLPPMGEGEVLVVGGTVEVLLGLGSLILIWAAGTKVSWGITVEASLFGALGAIILFGLGRVISWAAIKSSEGKSQRSWAKEILRFRDRVSIPLCEILSIPNAIALSVLAGLCEELFFRGALQPLVGAALTALAFTLLHFGPRIREWMYVPVIYLLVSLFFSGLYSFSSSLWAAIVAHALYDAIVLIDLKRTAPN